MRLARIVVALVVVLISSESAGHRRTPGRLRLPRSPSAGARIRRASNVGSWYCFYRLSFEHRDLIPAIVRSPRANSRAGAAQYAARRSRRRLSTTSAEATPAGAVRAGAGRVPKRGDVEGELHVAAAVVGHASWFGEAELRGGEAAPAASAGAAARRSRRAGVTFRGRQSSRSTRRTTDGPRSAIRQAEEHLTAAAPAWMRWRVAHTWGRVLIRPRLRRFADRKSNATWPICIKTIASDASNEDCRFTRNRIRHELLPLLAHDYNAQVVEAILRLGDLAGEMQAVVDEAVDELFSQRVRSENDSTVRIDTRGLAAVPPYLVRQLFIAIWQKQQWPLQAIGLRRNGACWKKWRGNVSRSPFKRLKSEHSPATFARRQREEHLLVG